MVLGTQAAKDPLPSMRISSRPLLNLAGRLGGTTVHAIMATARVSELVEDPSWHPQMGGPDARFLLALWHENLLLGGWAVGRFPGMVTLASASEDGEIAAGCAAGFGMEIIRGSSSQGGAEALKRIMGLAQRRIGFRLAITPDGPRGPRRTVKSGVVYVASRCRLPILCLGVACEDAWLLGSWDRMVVPKPFRRVQLYMTAPVFPDPTLSRGGLNDYAQFIASEVERAQRQAEDLLTRPVA